LLWLNAHKRSRAKAELQNLPSDALADLEHDLHAQQL
jgi:hypothetical protein